MASCHHPYDDTHCSETDTRLMVLFAPLALGSWWALIPAAFVIPMNVMRLHGEEELLARQLPAYHDYQEQTLFKLFPGIW